ncbi:hypothetical protein Scel_70400 [Streptomyces cellostaticus]|nr:hypothetical protein Scel_70400 [Streptomyces cellostaticus]
MTGGLPAPGRGTGHRVRAPTPPGHREPAADVADDGARPGHAAAKRDAAPGCGAADDARPAARTVLRVGRIAGTHACAVSEREGGCEGAGSALGDGAVSRGPYPQ